MRAVGDKCRLAKRCCCWLKGVEFGRCCKLLKVDVGAGGSPFTTSRAAIHRYCRYRSSTTCSIYFLCIAQSANSPAMNTLNSSKHTRKEHYSTLHYMCMQTVYCELSTGEFTGGGAPLSGAAGRKLCVQPPPLLTRQCTKFSSSSLCLVSMTTTTQRCQYMHVHIAGGGLCQLY